MTMQDAQNNQGKLVIVTLTNGQQASGTVAQITADGFTLQAYESDRTYQFAYSSVQSVVPVTTFTTTGIPASQVLPLVGHQAAIVYESVSGQIRVVGTVQSVDAANLNLTVNGTVNPIALSSLWSFEDLGVSATASVASGVSSFLNSGWGKALILSAVGVGGWLVGKNWDGLLGAAGIEPEAEEEEEEEGEEPESEGGEEGEEAPEAEGKED